MAIELMVVLAIALACWLFYPRKTRGDKAKLEKKRKADKLTVAKAKRDHPYQSVSLSSFGGGCNAVEAIVGQRYLVNGAPALPLQECTTTSHCNCRYIRHNDRRHLDRDRRLGIGMVTDLYEVSNNQDRRYHEVGGRRKTDRAA
jgi:hypothetical protein